MTKKNWYQKNRKKALAYSAEYYQQNKEVLLEKNRKRKGI